VGRVDGLGGLGQRDAHRRTGDGAFYGIRRGDTRCRSRYGRASEPGGVAPVAVASAAADAAAAVSAAAGGAGGGRSPPPPTSAAPPALGLRTKSAQAAAVAVWGAAPLPMPLQPPPLPWPPPPTLMRPCMADSVEAVEASPPAPSSGCRPRHPADQAPSIRGSSFSPPTPPRWAPD